MFEQLVSSTALEAHGLARMVAWGGLEGPSKHHLVARRGPGTVVGETAVMTRGVRTCSVVATGPVEVVVIPGDRFLQLLRSVPGLEGELKRVMAQRKAIRRMVEAVQQLGDIHSRIQAAREQERAAAAARGRRPAPKRMHSDGDVSPFGKPRTPPVAGGTAAGSARALRVDC